jgi:hypothetical protein
LFIIVSASCPSGQWQYGVSCYKVVDTLTPSWTNARDACSSQGGRLAIFDTRDKMQFILNLFRSGEHYFVKYLKVGLALKHSACCSFSCKIFLKCTGQATSSINDFYVGASRPLGSWGTEWPGGVPDLVWLNGVPVDWDWLRVNGYTLSTEPNKPTEQSALILSGALGSKQFANYYAGNNNPYICEFA